jgi:haloacetate dehalogenase
MFEGFATTDIETSGAVIRTVHGGSGPPLLLLHGNPLTHVMWHKVAPALAERFTVIATDLRGYGDSSKPEGGGDHSAYSFRAMAADQVEVMAALGYERFCVAGHDRGGEINHHHQNNGLAVQGLERHEVGRNKIEIHGASVP